MHKRNSQAGPQGTKAKPIPDAHSVADWVRLRTDDAYRQLPKARRDLITREQYERLALLCFHGENTFRDGDPIAEKGALIANFHRCLSLEFGITIEFVRLVRDKFGAEIGWRQNQARVAKGLPLKAKAGAVSLLLRNPQWRARLPADDSKLDDQADALGKLTAAIVSSEAYRKGRRIARQSGQ